MHGTFMEITRPEDGSFVWLAVFDDETKHFWAHDPETGKFHIKKGLALDYINDHELGYRALTHDEAVKIAAAPHARLPKALRDIHQADPCAVPAIDVLGDVGTPDARSLARSKARSIAETTPGTWVSWKVYNHSQKKTARVAASDIRNGKINLIARIAGLVGSRIIEHRDGKFEVQVARLPPAHAS